jgi:hypothetical protein
VGVVARAFTFSLRRASLTGREMALGWRVTAVSAIVCGSRLQECQLSVQAVDRGGDQRVRCEMERNIELAAGKGRRAWFGL